MCYEPQNHRHAHEVKQELTAAEKAAEIAQQTAVNKRETGSLPVEDEAHYEAHR